MVDEAKKYAFDGCNVLDLCTGSGAIAIAIQKETNANVVAVDVSKEALEVAKENAENNSAVIEFKASDMFSEISDRKFDIIVSNPPYIRSGDISGLQGEVKNYEPVIALDGGVDGLDFYKIIARDISKHLNNGGVVLLECGYDQAKDVSALFEGFEVEIIKDYSEIERIVKAKKNV